MNQKKINIKSEPGLSLSQSKKQIDSIEMQSISSLNRDGINEALDLIIQYLK